MSKVIQANEKTRCMGSLDINKIFYNIKNIMGAEFVLKIDVVDQGMNTEVVEHRTFKDKSFANYKRVLVLHMFKM